MKHHKLILTTVCLLFLIGSRVPHLTGPVDDPHSWRQCDTANYARAFHKDGINLLRPSVCWMGNYKTVVLEFPFPETLMAIAYNLFGPNIAYARLITLLFFMGSAIYLFFVVKYLFDDHVAFIATAIYIILPLSLFYSRAVHVDFCAVFFAHAMVYYFLRGYEEKSLKFNLVGMLAACMAFLVKAPYVFYFVLPLLCFMLTRFNLKKISCFLLLISVPVILFIIWHLHVNRINSAAPDWFFIPGYGKFVNMANWYYGPLVMRWDSRIWKTLLRRLQFEVVSKTGAYLFFLGLIGSFIKYITLKKRRRSLLFLWTWLAGVFCYLLIFLNLNNIHNYYQIPSPGDCFDLHGPRAGFFTEYAFSLD